MSNGNGAPEGAPPAGAPIDRYGGPTIDPTKNVLDLVRAQEKTLAELRVTDHELNKTQLKVLHANMKTIRAEQKWAFKFAGAVRGAEMRRIDQLTEQRRLHSNEISKILAKNVDSTQALVGAQLIQMQGTFDKRVSELEQFRWTAGGRSSMPGAIIPWIVAAIAAAGLWVTIASGGRLPAVAPTGNELAASVKHNSEVLTEVLKFLIDKPKP